MASVLASFSLPNKVNPSITGAYDLTAKKPLVHGNGGTRYEFYVYSGWRQHVIVEVDRHGIIRILKKESLDAKPSILARGIRLPCRA